MATRIDRSLGIREEVTFLGQDSSRLFAVTHLPLHEEVSGALLICPAICVDFIKNYRREVRLARELATKGIAVQRFHYLGTGNSDGHARDLTLDAMCLDARVATESLMSRTGLDYIAFMGTRWGALTAVDVARTFHASPIVLWEPVLSPEKYFREGYRSRLMSSLAKSTQEKPATTEYLDELERDGSIEISGFRISKTLIESTRQRDLVRCISDASHPLLLIQFGGRDHVRSAYAAAVKLWRERGLTVTVGYGGDSRNWWFLDLQSAADSEDGEIRLTVDWLDQQLPGEGGR